MIPTDARLIDESDARLSLIRKDGVSSVRKDGSSSGRKDGLSSIRKDAISSVRRGTQYHLFGEGRVIICSERDAISSFGNVVRKTILKSDGEID